MTPRNPRTIAEEIVSGPLMQYGGVALEDLLVGEGQRDAVIDLIAQAIENDRAVNERIEHEKCPFLTVKDVIQTCGACPSQWSAKTLDDHVVYIRYRWGYLSVRVDGKEVFGTQHGDGLDGVISMDEVCKIAKIAIVGYDEP